VGLSFCAIWYKALIAFMLNSGGFLSAINREADYNKERHDGKKEIKRLKYLTME